VPVLATGGVGRGEAQARQVGHGAQPGRGGVLLRHGEEEVAGSKAAALDVRAEFAGQLRAELETAVFLVFGIFLDEEPTAGWVEFRIHLHHCPADRQDSCGGIEVFYA
jgi:hypothetical protein